MHDRSEAFWDMPPSLPVCAASLRPSMPHAVQASVRIHALYGSLLSGPRRSFAGGLRSVLPSTSRARYVRSCKLVSMVVAQHLHWDLEVMRRVAPDRGHFNDLYGVFSLELGWNTWARS